MRLFGYFTIFVIVVALLYVPWATLVMVAAGMVHAQWLHAMPTMSFHQALALAWIPGVIFGGSASSASNRK